MQKLFRLTLATYTTIIGILIPVTVFIKSSSFNKNYYPATFVSFIALLTAIFLVSIYLLLLGDRNAFSKNIMRNILIALIATFFMIQILWVNSLFKEPITSIADMIVAIIFVMLMLCGLISLFGLIRRGITT
jgi:hypothetical protein